MVEANLLPQQGGAAVFMGPGRYSGDASFLLVDWLGVLVRHFRENQIGRLLQIVAEEHAVVSQGGAHAPGFGDDDGGLVRYSQPLFNKSETP